MTMSALPETVEVVIIRPIDGLGGLKKGQTFDVVSTVNRQSTDHATYTVMDQANSAASEASPTDMVSMAYAVETNSVWLWTLDAPEANIYGLRVPFEGFVAAEESFARCSASIGINYPLAFHH